VEKKKKLVNSTFENWASQVEHLGQVGRLFCLSGQELNGLFCRNVSKRLREPFSRENLESWPELIPVIHHENAHATLSVQQFWTQQYVSDHANSPEFGLL